MWGETKFEKFKTFYNKIGKFGEFYFEKLTKLGFRVSKSQNFEIRVQGLGFGNPDFGKLGFRDLELGFRAENNVFWGLEII